MTDAAADEFDTLATWTAIVAKDLGPDFHIPAGCRGSGSPAVLDWLLDELSIAAGETLLDSGAGVGGPAAYAATQRGARPVLLEPQPGGVHASRALFGFPAVRADASLLPFADDSFDAAWALGVLCTTESQVELLSELERVVRPPGRVGLLVLVAKEQSPAGEPDDSYFPTADSLGELLNDAGFRVDASRSAADLWDPPARWKERLDTFESELRARYGDESAWQGAERQSDRIGKLLANSTIVPYLFSLRHAITP